MHQQQFPANGASGGFDVATLYFDLCNVNGWINQKCKLRSRWHEFTEEFRATR
jgi:hypothetical protein